MRSVQEFDLTRAAPRARDLWSLGVLPILAGGALSGLLGVYWDIAWHIDIGRDTFFTLPHNFLYAGMAAVLFTSLYGLWRDRRDTPFHLGLGTLRLHLGVLMVAVGAALVLLFAPMDDLWHRLFGTDVTLWAPMHLIGLLGMTLGCFGALVSAWLEGRLAQNPARRRFYGGLALYFAAILMGWSTLLQAEYEFNVPQFPSPFHPVLLAALPTFIMALASRLSPRPWSATLVTLAFSLLRVLLAGFLITTSSLGLAGQTRPMIPLLFLSAMAVDLLTRRGTAPWLVGLVAGGITLLGNWLLVSLGNGIAWYGEVVALAALPALALAALAGWAGSAVAEALKGREVAA